jgi:hypothetical protein
MAKNSMDKYEKYDMMKPFLKDGDIFLFRGNSWLSKSIQFFDKSYYNHTGIGLWVYVSGVKRYCIIDMNENDRSGNGCRIDWMSGRIKDYVDFDVVRVVQQNKIVKALKKVQSFSELRVGYDYNKIFAFIFHRLFKSVNLKKIIRSIFGEGKSNRFICSELVQEFCLEAGVKCYSEHKMFSPQDIIRYMDKEEIMFIH